MRSALSTRTLPLEVTTLLNEGQLIDAIKALRVAHPGLGLAEAKGWIDEYLSDNPVLRVQLETRQRESRRRWFLWFLLVDALITGAVIYYLLYVRGPG
jgi:hypothetical protein